MKKISLLISDISQSGGTERATINLANMLADTFEVEIISFHNKQDIVSTFYEINDKVKLTSFKLEVKSHFKNLIENYNYLKKYFPQNKVDYIIGTWYGSNILLPFFKNRNTKVIACEHADFETTPKLVKTLEKILYPKLDGIVMLSELAKYKISNYNKKVVVIPNSLPFKSSLVSNHLSKKILMLGRFVYVKGYERVIPLAKYLENHYPEWSIDIYGDGELKESIQSQIENAELKSINIYSPKKDVQQLYIDSSIYLSTSYNEAMPMVFLEAMSCGVPVISYSHEGAKTLINHNIDGFLVNDLEELIKYCKFLIDNFDSRIEMGAMGKSKSVEYSEDKIREKWLNLLYSL